MDSSAAMWDLNTRLKGFLVQVDRLQEANRRLESRIADRDARSGWQPQDWSHQEQTIGELRAQVRLHMEALLVVKGHVLRESSKHNAYKCKSQG